MRYLGRLLTLVLALVVGVWSVVFSLSNQAEVSLDLVVFELSSQRVSLWIVGAFVLGALGGMLSASGALFRSWRRQSLMAREIRRHGSSPGEQSGGDEGH